MLNNPLVPHESRVSLRSNGPTSFDLILDFNERFGAAVKAGKQSERDKLLVQAGGWLHLASLGGLAKTGEVEGEPVFAPSDEIAALLVRRNIKNKVDTFQHCAQLVLGYVLELITDKTEKKDARNLVVRCGKLFQCFQHFGTQEASTFPNTEEALADWITANNGIDGLWKRYSEDTLVVEVEDGGDDADLGEFEDAIATRAVTIKTDVPLAAFAPTLSLTRMGEEGEIKVLPLPAVPPSVIAQLARYLPAIDANMPDRARFWADIATICGIAERQEGDVAARPTEESHAARIMAPSHPIVWIESDRQMTVAPSRLAAGVVVKVSSHVGTGLPTKDIVWPRHLNGLDTGKLMAGMAGGFARASIEDAKYDLNTQRMSFPTSNTRVQPFWFGTRASSAFGSSKHHEQWTLDVTSFEQRSHCRTDLAGEGILPDMLTKFVAKAASGRHATKVRISKDELSFALGEKAQAIVMPSGNGGTQTDTVTVASVDLVRVVNAIAELRPIVVAVGIDTGGLLGITCQTQMMTARFYIPTLLSGGDRNPAKLKRVRKPAAETAQRSLEEPEHEAGRETEAA